MNIPVSNEHLRGLPGYFFAVDFDGTIINEVDVFNAVMARFADPKWREYEDMWERNEIGSGQCLASQLGLIRTGLPETLAFVRNNFRIDYDFKTFAAFMQRMTIPYAILSDGFKVFINLLLAKDGMENIPVFANDLYDLNGKLTMNRPHARTDCPAALCKCATAAYLSGSRKIALIGDGRSDFCLAQKADIVFARGKLQGFCDRQGIKCIRFDSFNDIVNVIRAAASNDNCPNNN